MQPEHIMELSFTKPPLTMNDRRGWRTTARITKELRREAWIRAKATRIGRQDHITVTLHYQAPDRRRRDAGNLMPTHKALIDGLVDAGIIPDDTPQYVNEKMPIIHPPAAGQPAKCWLVIAP
ncbi:hypothetical protein ACT3S7_04465 [Corynebacterium sp. AOP34-AQ2-28]|uniref:hypothetical protein n=1 Tax=Corynebacterium sp. AOP34-AQ2-28 TaxID=3457689 RepID=UPI0040338409